MLLGNQIAYGSLPTNLFIKLRIKPRILHPKKNQGHQTEIVINLEACFIAPLGLPLHYRVKVIM